MWKMYNAYWEKWSDSGNYLDIYSGDTTLGWMCTV